MVSPETQNAEEQELVDRVLASSLFRKSPRLSSFLRFVYLEQVGGRENAINEQLIGTEVFGRRSGYHVGDDSIVRSQARFLRQRLEQYFETEGLHERLILTIPKGSYVPAFKEREVVAALPTDALLPELPPSSASNITLPPQPFPSQPGPWRNHRAIALVTLATICLIAATTYLLLRERKPALSRDEAITHVFWASIFTPQRSVLFIPADTSLVSWERISGKPVDLRSYMSKDYAKSPPDTSGIWERMQNSRYTSISDLDLLAELERIPEAQNSRFQIRYGGDLSLTELKVGNAILSGGPMANPWVELFYPTMHFTLVYDPEIRHTFVLDRENSQKPDTRYAESGDGGEQGYQSYGVIGYLPSLDGIGHDLLIEGTSKTGTEAAAEFLKRASFAHFLRDIGGNESGIPSFEILLSAQSLVGATYSSKVIAWHKLPLATQIQPTTH